MQEDELRVIALLLKRDESGWIKVVRVEVGKSELIGNLF